MRKDKTFSNNEINNIHSLYSHTPLWNKLNQIKSSEQPWFWPGIIPLQHLTLFAGQGGIGKSILLLYLAAKTTTGEKFTAGGFEHQLSAGDVIILSAEDDYSFQLKPKLIAMNADPSKIHLLKTKIINDPKKEFFVDLDKDIEFLEDKINELNSNVRLIIIDPITYFIGDIRDHINKDVANFLNDLVELAKKHNIAILISKHLRKGSSGASVIKSASNEVGGAGAWTNSPRKNWLVANHPDDNNLRVISQLKDNISKKSDESLVFKIEETTIEDEGLFIKTTKLMWLDEKLSITADEAVDKLTYNKSKLEQGIDFIYDYLNDNGQSLLKNIQQAALLSGIKQKTFRKSYEQFEQIYSKSIEISKGIKGAKIYRLKDIDDK